MKKTALFTGLAVVSAMALPAYFTPQAHAAIPAGSVVVNEIMYDYASGTSQPEWVELYNTTGSAIDLSGYKLSDNNVDATSKTEGDFTFPSGTTIPANGYITVGNSYATGMNYTWTDPNFALANSGDNVALYWDANNDNIPQSSEVIDNVVYTSSWGGAANGYSIERISPTGGDTQSNFAQSTVSGGTPGAQNSVTTGGTGGGGGTVTDPYEPNDSLAQAYGPITSGSTYNGAITTSTDQDWYKFTTAGTGTISVSLSNLPADYDVYLCDANGTQLASSTNTGTAAESITFNATSTGTYYVEVVGKNGAFSTTQTYAMSATYPTQATVTDPYEPNGSMSQAYGPITSGSTYNGALTSSTDQDWYKFTTGGTGTISASLTNLPADYDLYLYDANGTQLASSTNTGTAAESISYNATSTGTYYVEVVGKNGAFSTTQTYSMSTTYPTSGGNPSPSGKKVLWDQGHGETAGNADWTITGANSSFADALTAKGYSVSSTTSQFTSSLLSGYNVLVLPEPNINYTAAEESAIISFIQNGGGVYFIADHYKSDRNNDGWDSTQIYDANQTSPTGGNFVQQLGFYFDFNNVSLDPITGIQSTPLTTGVSSFGYWNGSTIHSTGTNSSIAPDIFMSGQTDPVHIHGTFGTGRFAALGDSSPYDDGTGAAGKNLYDGWDADNCSTMGVNTVMWLAGDIK